MAPFVVISAAYGTLGDVAPMLGLAERMLSRGVAVTLVVDAYFLPRARALSGARVETLGTVEEYQALLDDVQGRWNKPADTVRFWLRRLNDHYTLLARLADEAPGQVAFIGHALDLPVRLLQERRGVPAATVLLQPWMLRSKGASPSQFAGMRVRGWYPRWLKAAAYKVQDVMVDFAYAPQLNAFRTELGLAPVKRVYHRWYLCDGPILGLWPRWLANEPDFPARLRMTDFPFTDGATEEQPLSDALTAFMADAQAASAPVYAFTLGSAPPPYAATFFAAAIEACGHLGARAVLLCGSAALLPAALPPHAHHVEYAPFSSLLPLVAVFAYNGGFGGFSQACRAGVPQLVVPGRFDQPHNALTAARFGVGVRLDAKDVTPRSMAAALCKLSAPGVKAKCAELAGRCRAESGAGLERAADTVIEFAQASCTPACAAAQ